MSVCFGIREEGFFGVYFFSVCLGGVMLYKNFRSKLS